MHRPGSAGPILRPSAVVTSVFLRSRQETGIPLDGQRLVYKGEVLGSGSVQECGLNEDDFLVVVVVRMPSRPSPTAALGNPAEGQRSLMHARQLLPETGHEPLGVAERVFAGSAARDDLSVHTEPARQQVAVELSDLVQALATTLGTREMMPSVPAQHSAHGIDDAHDDAPAEGSGEDLDEDDGGEEEGHALEHAEAALRQLVDMGFPENRARKALQICRGNAQAGMDWLLEHEGDPDIDDPLSAEQLRRLEQDMGRGGDPQDQQEAVERLVEMGFSEDDILVALDTCNHDFEAAAAWLLGDNVGPRTLLPWHCRDAALLASSVPAHYDVGTTGAGAGRRRRRQRGGYGRGRSATRGDGRRPPPPRARQPSRGAP